MSCPHTMCLQQKHINGPTPPLTNIHFCINLVNHAPSTLIISFHSFNVSQPLSLALFDSNDIKMNVCRFESCERVCICNTHKGVSVCLQFPLSMAYRNIHQRNAILCLLPRVTPERNKILPPV